MAQGRNTPPGPVTAAIAAILHTAFLELLTTQTAFGARIGLSQSRVSELLSGQKVVDIEILVRMCDVLDLDVAQVVRVAVDATRSL